MPAEGELNTSRVCLVRWGYGRTTEWTGDDGVVLFCYPEPRVVTFNQISYVPKWVMICCKIVTASNATVAGLIILIGGSRKSEGDLFLTERK